MEKYVFREYLEEYIKQFDLEKKRLRTALRDVSIEHVGRLQFQNWEEKVFLTSWWESQRIN